MPLINIGSYVCIFVLVCTHTCFITFSFFKVASVLLIFGVKRGIQWIMVPGLVINWIFSLILIILLLFDIAYSGVYSQYLSLIAGYVIFALFHLIAASITFWQIRDRNVKNDAINNLNYINMDDLNPSI